MYRFFVRARRKDEGFFCTKTFLINCVHAKEKRTFAILFLFSDSCSFFSFSPFDNNIRRLAKRERTSEKEKK